MELLNSPFVSTLLAIIVIDLVLAGDNAIVIALAARRLPAALQKRAIVWGTLGAVVVRVLLTIVVVQLLQLPGLMLAGGLLLVWIACKLLIDNASDSTADTGAQTGSHAAPTTFWAAMRTIIIADGVMGLDNMLAVAGASHGDVSLVVLGLVISIPIMVWGSTLILKALNRWPALVYVGAAVLAWTAAHMMLAEPMLAGRLALWTWTNEVVTVTVVAGVLATGWLVNRRTTRSAVQQQGDNHETPDSDRRVDGLAAGGR